MAEVDGLDFYNKVTDSTSETREYTLTDGPTNAELTVTLKKVGRKQLLDELNKLPDEMMETIAEAEDEEEAEELAKEQNMLSGVNGDVVDAFEALCAESMEHDDLTTHHFEEMVKELSFEALFELGAEVVDLSFEQSGRIEDFQPADSGRSS